MKSIFSNWKTLLRLVAIPMAVSNTVNATDNDWEVQFSTIIRVDEASNFDERVQLGAAFQSANCVDIPFNPGIHKVINKLLPAPDPDGLREEYTITIYRCRPASNQLYELFNKAAIYFARKHTDYYVRLLVDTVEDPSAACIRKFCSADGLYHRTPNPPGAACSYCP